MACNGKIPIVPYFFHFSLFTKAFKSAAIVAVSSFIARTTTKNHFFYILILLFNFMTITIKSINEHAKQLISTYSLDINKRKTTRKC